MLPLFQAMMLGTAGSQWDDTVLLNHPGISSGKKSVTHTPSKLHSFE